MKFFILSTFDKHDKTQLLTKLKKILYMGFRATLNFQKFKVARNPMYRIFLNFVMIVASSDKEFFFSLGLVDGLLLTTYFVRSIGSLDLIEIFRRTY